MLSRPIFAEAFDEVGSIHAPVHVPMVRQMLWQQQFYFFFLKIILGSPILVGFSLLFFLPLLCCSVLHYKSVTNLLRTRSSPSPADCHPPPSVARRRDPTNNDALLTNISFDCQREREREREKTRPDTPYHLVGTHLTHFNGARQSK